MPDSIDDGFCYFFHFHAHTKSAIGMVPAARRFCGDRSDHHEPGAAVADVFERVGAQRRTNGNIFPGAILRQPGWRGRDELVAAAIGLFQSVGRRIFIFDAGHGVHGSKSMAADGGGCFDERIWIRTGEPDDEFARNTIAVV